MAIFFRVGNVGLHDGKLFCCATRVAAENWKRFLGRKAEIVRVDVEDTAPCIINTHGYCEADWRVSGVEDKKRVYRVPGTAREISELAQLCEGEEGCDYHEVVFDAPAVSGSISFF